MRLKLIACNVFQREVCYCLARTPHVIDVEFTELGEHIHSDSLRAIIQQRIDAAEQSAKEYDAILLLFGLCGNAAIGLSAQSTPLVIPRAHDCCTILLGSRDKFVEYFGDNPSMPFSSSGYLERGDYFLRTGNEDSDHVMHFGDGFAAMVEQYGEEDARYIWDTMYPQKDNVDEKVVFIELEETAGLGYSEQFRNRAEAEGKECLMLEGDIRLVQQLINGEWPEEEYLIVQPGKITAGVYDFKEVIRAESKEEIELVETSSGTCE